MEDDPRISRLGQGSVEPLDDLQIYRELHNKAEELEAMAPRAASPATETALQACAKLIRRLASALWISLSRGRSQ